MRFIYYNPETKIGYISDPLTAEDGEFIAAGIGIYVGMCIISVFIAATILLPFLIVSGMDKFLISFVSVNRNFIIGAAIALLVIKFFTVNLSSVLFVRFLFALMIMVPVLYILLYKFNLADITISIGKRFELSKSMLGEVSTQETWCDPIVQNIMDAASKVFFFLTSKANSIDRSAFSSSLSTIDVAAVILCIGKMVLWWGLLLILSLLIFMFGLIAMFIIIGLPYFIAFGLLILSNNLIYNTKRRYVRYLKL